MEWVSPTGHNDPQDKWSDESLAYDDNISTGADTSTLYQFLELTHSPINSCSKVRVMILEYKGGTEYDSTDCRVLVYYAGGWHQIYLGYINKNVWQEIEIGSTQTVTAMELYYKTKSAGGAHLLWKEADFWGEGEAPPPSYIPQLMMIT